MSKMTPNEYDKLIDRTTQEKLEDYRATHKNWVFGNVGINDSYGFMYFCVFTFFLLFVVLLFTIPGQGYGFSTGFMIIVFVPLIWLGLCKVISVFHNERISKACDEILSDATREKNDYRRSYESDVERSVDQYLNSPFVLRAAETLSNYLLSNMRNVSHDSSRETIKLEWELLLSEDFFEIGHERINFTKEGWRYEPIEGTNKRAAVLRAIAEKIRVFILAAAKNGNPALTYDRNISITAEPEKWEGSLCTLIIHYSASNTRYEPPRRI